MSSSLMLIYAWARSQYAAFKTDVQAGYEAGAARVWNAARVASDDGLRSGTVHFAHDTRAQGGGGNLVGLLIGVMIAAIVALRVFVPVVNSAIEDSNLTGAEKSIAEMLSLFAILMILVALASPLIRQVA